MTKSVTIKDVAERAGVSKASVWAALKTGESGIRLAPKTRERIQNAVRELNYRPNIVAQSMVSQKSYLVGFNFNCSSNLWYHTQQLLMILCRCCEEKDYSLVVYTAGSIEEEAKNLKLAINRRLDALITLPVLIGSRHNGEEYKRIAKEIMPVVQVCLPLWPELPSIAHDFRYIAKRASEYLIGRGHRQIVLVTFDNYRDPYNGISSFEHNQGYQMAMTKANLNPKVVSHGGNNQNQPADDAYQIAEQILQLSPRPTAIVTSSNNTAFGLIKRWEELGIKVPDDISIIGCANDLNIPDCLNSGLSSFETAFEDIGKRAFHLCLEQKKQIKPKQFRIKLQLLEGKTVRNL